MNIEGSRPQKPAVFFPNLQKDRTCLLPLKLTAFAKKYRFELAFATVEKSG
ncbi:hypothetical protein [Paenibacillus sp. SSG-1]|uniref:hypothetical protein n=1 Tax=Paenibacillus sp. SSG-1 TaxID=1443669 RepID=UPI001C5303AF|nr:hypothetical protein [Paenibacillus sp. SSG-1]